MKPTDSRPERHDVLVIHANHLLGMTPATIRSLLQYLSAAGIALPKEEAIARTWSEIYMVPGPAAHDAFVLGAYQGETPLFYEAVLRVTDEPELLPFGPKVMARWTLQFLGSTVPEPTGPFMARLKANWLIVGETFHRPHAGLLPHRVVPPEERPPEKTPGRDPGAIGVGIRVIER